MKFKSYILLGTFLLLNIIIVPLFMSAGGLTRDGASYIHLAYEIPNPSWSLFPLGYPAFLRAFNYIFNDYYWSSRFVNIVVFISILLFSYFKRFYFKETVILLSTKIFIYLFYLSMSEPLFLGCLYFLFYYIEGYFTGRLKSYHFFLPAAMILTFSFVTRYSGVYIAVALGVFYLIYYFANRKSISFFRNDFFYFLLLSALGISGYMVYNYYYFGDIAGEKFRQDPYVSVSRNVLSLFNSFNPVLGIKLNSSSYLAWIVEFFLLSINLFFIYWFVKIWKREFKKRLNWFHFLLIFTGVIYSLFLFFTSFYQGIEELNIRMLCESSFCYFWSIVLLYFKQKKNEKLIFRIAVFTLIFTAIYTLKNPVNFIEYKKNMTFRLSKMKEKKYFYNNSVNNPDETIYEIPIIHKKIKYVHQNMQKGKNDAIIITTENPRILQVNEDTIQNKKEVIYATDLK